MLPTRPRALARSTCSSCTTPCSSIATRVSCGVTLMRISCVINARSQHLETDAFEELGRFVQRQHHHSGIAAVDVADECCRAALYRVAACLVERLARGYVAFHLVVAERAKRHARARYRQHDL